ncbi:MAG: DUF1015 domain-containing protein [Acholeplasmatales bacterium]|nr:DUF1015 domain-containing protein [Acholeplasmatales bacterium]
MAIVEIPKILLPKKNIDYSKWSVIACDQHTSEEDYWNKVNLNTKGSLSTINLVLPEIYLKEGEAKVKERVAKINSNMKEYIDNDIFNEVNSFIFVKREMKKNLYHYGLMISVDLEEYDYSPKSNLPIRATEKTVPERLPVRIDIRLHAPLELPHILLLMDDRKDEIFNYLKKEINNMDKLYDFNLMENAGHIEGYKVNDSNKVKDMILKLLDPKTLKEKYGSDSPILFAVGDGNHSLAAAKECWNKIKAGLTEEEKKTHPARFALCELQNIYDESLEFEPIHRVVMNADKSFIDYLLELKGPNKVLMEYQGNKYYINVSNSPADAIFEIQNKIDSYLKDHKNVEIDYIHDEDSLRKVAKETNGIAIYMPTITKESLFNHVANEGVLPRKSFSMGSANTKRFYLEAKKIR